eukprot:6203608-Pleurochrysis_carterae.AAC.1
MVAPYARTNVCTTMDASATAVTRMHAQAITCAVKVRTHARERRCTYANERKQHETNKIQMCQVGTSG